jgi:hypothetical protein
MALHGQLSVLQQMLKSGVGPALTLKRPLRQADDLTALECGLVGEDTGAGDVGALDQVRVSIGSGLQHFDELMHEVRMTPTVARVLGEREALSPHLRRKRRRW